MSDDTPTPAPQDGLDTARQRIAELESALSACSRGRFPFLVLEAIPAPIFVKNENHRWVFLNRAFVEAAGIPREAMLGKSDYEYFPKDQAEVFWAMDDRVLATGEVNVNEEFITFRDRVLRILTVKSLFVDPASGRKYVVGYITDITERRRMEDELRASEERFRTLVENSADCIFEFDAEYRFTYNSPAVRHIIGYSPEELLGKSPADLSSKEEIERILARIGPNLAECRPYRNLLQRCRRKDGGEALVEVSATPIFDAEGRFAGYRGITRDVTEREKAAEALRASEERFRALVESSSDCIWEQDPEMRFTYLSPKVLDILGYAPEEMLGKTPLDLTAPEDVSTLLEEYGPLLGQRQPFRAVVQRCLRKDGRVVAIESSGAPAFDAAGRFVGYRGVTRDVTARILAEEALRASEERLRQSHADLERRVEERTAELARAEIRYRSIYENAPIGIFQKSLQGRFLAANAQLARIYGYESPEELLAEAPEAPHSLYVDPGAWAAMRRLLENQDTLDSFEVLVRRRDGRLFWTSRMVRVVRDAAGKAVFYEGFVTDVSDRRQAEERVHALTRELLRAQERERQRISRELHDNMAQTLSSLTIAWKTMFDGHPEVPDEVRERARGLAGHLSGLIRSVRDLAYDLRPPILDELGLARAMRMHCEEFADLTGLNVEFSAAGMDNLALDTDTAINIFRLVQESLRNVAKHSGASRVGVKLVASHPLVLVRVEDDGRGFDPAERGAQAVGERRMGLQGMEERVLLLGGTFKVQSRPGQGARIVAEIPVLAPKAGR